MPGVSKSLELPCLVFWAKGQPAGEPRPRAEMSRGRMHVHRSERADPWKRTVQRACLDELGRPIAPRQPVFAPDEPLAVFMQFTLPRPAAHHVARDKARELRSDAPTWVLPKPDIDNLAKAVLDALGPWPRGSRPILWSDDQQVVELVARKLYVYGNDEPGVFVTVRSMAGAHTLRPPGEDAPPVRRSLGGDTEEGRRAG